MKSIGTSRRDYLKALTAGTLLTGVACKEQTPAQPTAAVTHSPASPPPEHDRRIQWWRDAKFGMFIHWGLYSQLGRQEWVMSIEDIPVAEYEKLAKTFKPKPDAARAWARLAKQARPEVYGDDHQAPRRVLPVRLQAHRLLRAQARPRPRPGEGIRGRRARGGLARGLLLFTHGLAPSRWHALQGRPGRAPALRRLHPRADSRNPHELRQDRCPLVRRGMSAGRRGLAIGEDE